VITYYVITFFTSKVKHLGKIMPVVQGSVVTQTVLGGINEHCSVANFL